jgi:hypothetical protein
MMSRIEPEDLRNGVVSHAVETPQMLRHFISQFSQKIKVFSQVGEAVSTPISYGPRYYPFLSPLRRGETRGGRARRGSATPRSLRLVLPVGASRGLEVGILGEKPPDLE